ncbi:uncharacterized protein LOC105383149 isoform X3 [Plutella xylostella]|uniref:uncharacterized protein LOC105383149 isoform X3 n=1 Tax=Plutella xylostella TaxID=51655 RepID=UPI002032FB74|nr:uncharacterized protein LOC105383149 isoform X3 [Plutella xylostella]
MKLNNHMEGGTIATENLITSIASLGTESKENNTIHAILKNFLASEKEMAIKQNESANKYIYTVPVKSPTTPYKNDRVKSLNDAKEAFLKSTVSSSDSNVQNYAPKKEEVTLHYAQIAVTTASEDTRSTGGGINPKRHMHSFKNEAKSLAPDVTLMRKKIEQQQQRKVSFKIKNASSSHRRPPLATRTVTITSNKVSELTNKFNNLVQESHNGTVKQSKLVKTIESLQNSSKSTGSSTASSTPTSTLSTSPNIKIVIRQKRGSKKRNHRKRCSSVDSIDKLILSDSSSAKIRVIRSKSDGNKIPKSPKKRLKSRDSSSQPSGSDSVDGSPVKPKKEEPAQSPPENESTQSNVVKNVIKKFECEIIAQYNADTLTRKTASQSKPITKEKPKVPEKKSTLVVTKNLVVKDGVPKIKTVKPPAKELPKPEIVIKEKVDLPKKEEKKEPIYDKRRFKTNYIHADKMPLHVVEIVHEDTNEHIVSKDTSPVMNTSVIVVNSEPNDSPIRCVSEERSYEELSSRITPNESFLWRRKSSTQIYSDGDRSISDSSYSLSNVTLVNDPIEEPKLYEDSPHTHETESHSQSLTEINTENPESSSDFESNLVEAYNKEILVGFTSKPSKEAEVEDDYEPLEPYIVETPAEIVVPVKKIDRTSKINCPLPEIPKEEPLESQKTTKENIYQCLLEMRSHPEGDESSLHSYELCSNQMEERTRGDGDSDHGYEYCKSPIKPYCHASSAGIQIAEDYQPCQQNDKHYAISKSVSGTSTVSYEKIGSERIYEKIPCRPPKSKDSSPSSYSNRHSIVSSDYNGYNEDENIYDTIKHSDGASLSHCYESIPNSPSFVKLRTNFKKQLASAVQKRLSFDTVSNVSQSTLSSEQKTNSIYGQRSVMSYSGQEAAFPAPGSDTSVSGSDRSDEWVDVSDEEKTDEQKIVIVRERSRGRKSPISWSQKVRHQWQKSPKQKAENKEGDSSDSGHLYESLEPAPAPLDDDFDSFDSDSDSDTQPEKPDAQTHLPAKHLERLPEPPTVNTYTLTSIASAAQRKIRALKRNLTKRYTVAIDGISQPKTPPQLNLDNKTKTKSPIYANCEKPDIHVYSNMTFHDTKPVLNKSETPLAKVNGNFKEELKTVIGEKRIYGERKISAEKKVGSDKKIYETPPPLPAKIAEKPTTPTSEGGKKDNGTLSRKAYFSFKSRFRRASSVAVDINTDVPSALKITNSTFYLTDSMDGDSGFSNCDSAALGSTEHMESPPRPARRPRLSDSTPCLPLERPALPPPPPPPPAAVHEELKRLLPTLSRKEKGPRTRTSWYAECGDETPPSQPSPRPSTTSWYAEAGLYQAGSVTSSSGASSASPPASPPPRSLFTHEPLYQFYNKEKVQSACLDSDSDAYDPQSASSEPMPPPSPPAAPARPSAMALAAPRGPQRTLWCEVPDVVASPVLSTLPAAQKRLQEAKFELLTSEASYLNSLNVLETHFMSHPAFRDPSVISQAEWDTLFSTILPVRKCSQLLMTSLERCWQADLLLGGICRLLLEHANRHFQAYVKCCEHQHYMVKTLQALRERPAFAAALRRLESHPACQSLSLQSFLMLPMQRVTRLPLLLDAVLRHLPDGRERRDCAQALRTLHQIVSQCNEGARNTERAEEMWRLCRAIEFPPHVRAPPALGPALRRRDRTLVRYLVRSGEMTQLVWKTDELKLTFGKKFHKVPLHLFLFNDVLVITKKKSEDSYIAVDHCARSLLEVCSSDGGAAQAKHALLLTLLENHEGRTVEMLMSCPSDTDASRWTEAVSPPPSDAAEAVYAGWDCPQQRALFDYAPVQPDELPLSEGDVLNVTRKTAEGWYYGERLRDGETGWFPGSYTVEVASPHVRARNLRQRYRLLALSGTYLGQKRRT